MSRGGGKPGGGKGLSEEDLLIWRRVARTARPLPGRRLPEAPSQRLTASRPTPSGDPAREAPSRPSLMSETARPEAEKKPGPPPDLSGEKRVRRGKLDVEATLDLHGMTLASGRAALGRFLAQARFSGMRVVLVVTGKGRGGEGALRRALPDWLAEEAAHVSGYAPAHQRHGGGGAVYVRLRRPPAPAR